MVKKNLFQRIFGRKLSMGEIVLSLVSLSAGTLTILQNLNLSSSLSVGIEQSVTKTPINFWSLFIGVLLIISIILFIRGKR